MIVTIDHFRTIPGFSAKPGFCVPGGRLWFRTHGLDWRAFVRHGIDAETLRATGDGFALAIVAWAEQEAAHGR